MIQPIRKQILFKPFPGEEKSLGGIIVPEAFREPSNKGEVVAVGALCKKVRKGDVAFRVKEWGQPISEDGVNYFLMDEDAVLAIN
jgi:chaperonin GroES